jgi:hypothetical protein
VAEPVRRVVQLTDAGRALNVEEFTTLTEAQVLTEQWRIEYNTIRPHSALAGYPPDEYAESGKRTSNPHQHSHSRRCSSSWWRASRTHP